MSQLDQSIQVLRNVFGHRQFRAQQKKIVDQLIDGSDALILMPTGGGKSLCFQLPSIIRDGTGVVISPLISLMQDQVESLKDLGLNAHAYNSTLTATQKRKVEKELREGIVDFLYMAPERLCLERTLDLLDNIDISLFAIDEAHCVSSWGHDFRPEYRKLKILADRYPSIPKAAFTATADKLTRTDIIKQLALEDAKVFLSSFNRTNLHYSITEKKGSGVEQFLEFYEGDDGFEGESGIVYCLSRRKVEEVAEALQKKGVNALAYHAGLHLKERKENQETFLLDEGVVIVATIAFGMGIDKADVRFVAHLDMPKSLESYYQETGRAGRDGDPATVWMTYGKRDFATYKGMIKKSRLPKDREVMEIEGLETMLSVCESKQCRRQSVLQSFDEDFRAPCGLCDNCDQPAGHDSAIDKREWALSLIGLVHKYKGQFNIYHLVDFIQGLVTLKCRDLGLFEHSDFGFGQKFSERGAFYLIRQMMASGLLRADWSDGGACKITALSVSFVKSEEPFWIKFSPLSYAKSSPKRKVDGQKKKAKKKKRGAKKIKRKAPASNASFGLCEQSLNDFNRLRELRKGLAKKKRRPAYTIFHDQTLREMILKRPQNLDELSEINGVGDVKLKKYGKIFLEAIQ